MQPINFLNDTIHLVHDIGNRFIELAARLHEIRSKRLWETKYDDYEQFLEIAGISPSTATVLVKVHESFVIKGGMTAEKLAGVPYSNLYQAIPLLANEDVETVVAKAKILTRNEITEEVREVKHGDCKHEEHITICADCKKRIYEDGK